MEVDSPSHQSSPSTPSITPAQRITELNQIDTSISHLLRSASTATSILSNQTASSPTTLPSAKEAFTTAAQTYFSTLSSIEVRLRRQVYALEEAGLIAAGTERDARRGRTLNMDDGVRGRGGGGALDPSWLNARVGEGVEVQKKREILQEGKALVGRIAKREGGEMDVDEEKEEG